MGDDGDKRFEEIEDKMLLLAKPLYALPLVENKPLVPEPESRLQGSNASFGVCTIYKKIDLKLMILRPKQCRESEKPLTVLDDRYDGDAF